MSDTKVNSVLRGRTRSGDPLGDMLSYVCESRPWIKQIIAIAHNAKAFDLHFILYRAVFLKWRPELIMSGQ